MVRENQSGRYVENPCSALHSVTLYCIDPARNMQRFYRLDIQRDLFGNQCLIREWGRIGRSGQARIISYPTGDEALAALEKQRTRKERRGYAVVVLAPPLPPYLS